jgi:drug/metabolite transporter (DMT)-like permease
VAALFFSATALYTKWMSAREKFNSYQTLFPMMLFSLPLLLLSSLLWERGQPLALHLMDLVAFGYQTIGAQFLAYVLWFWLIYRYPVGQLASFTFLNPLVGVILSTYLLGEHPPETLWLGLLLVAAGIVLVNWPQRAKKAAGH